MWPASIGEPRTQVNNSKEFSLALAKQKLWEVRLEMGVGGP